MTGARGMARSAASALVGMAAAASASVAADTTAILPNFSIMLLPLIICLPNETSNKARAGISRPPSRDISRYGKSENRWSRGSTSGSGLGRVKTHSQGHSRCLAVLERLPVCPDNQTYSELVQTSLSGQPLTLWQTSSGRRQPRCLAFR